MMQELCAVMRERFPVLPLQISVMRKRSAGTCDRAPVMRSESGVGYELSCVSPVTFR